MAQDGRVLISASQVSSDVSLGDVSDGQMVQRDWVFAVNEDPEFQSYLDNETTDPSNALMYYDCTMYADGQLLGNVMNPKLVYHPETIQFRGAGAALNRTRYAGHSWTLEFSEMVVQDSLLFQKVIAQGLASSGSRRSPRVIFQVVQKATTLAEA